MTNQVILKNTKSFCSNSTYFLFTHLICLISTNMSDIESRMFLLYAYAMTIRILKQKLVQLINYYQKKIT